MYKRQLVTWFAVFLIFAALVWEDALNGRVAFRRIPPGLATSNTTFDEQGYHSVTEVGSSDFPYSNIVALAQTEGYFVFVFGKNHGQVYDKAGISGAVSYTHLKSEGLILGLAAKMFVVAGPVLVYGILTSSAYGLVLFLIGWLEGVS